MNTIIITGSHSLLGTALIKTIPSDTYRIVTTWHRKHPAKYPKHIAGMYIDITNPTFVSRLFKKYQPQIIVHAAAISDIDYCEKNKEETSRVNVSGTRNIIHACRQYGTKIIFISTNAVFDGAKAPYKEDDITHPIVFYGKTKLKGEQLVQKSGLPFSIVRLTTMYGYQPEGARLNPATWILEEFRQKKKLYMVSDRFTNPLFNLSAAEAIRSIIINNKEGIFHVAGRNTISRYDFATMIASVFGLPDAQIMTVTSSFFPQLTGRPVDTSFSTKKMEQILRLKPLSLYQGLLRMQQEKHENV